MKKRADLLNEIAELIIKIDGHYEKMLVLEVEDLMKRVEEHEARSRRMIFTLKTIKRCNETKEGDKDGLFMFGGTKLCSGCVRALDLVLDSIKQKGE